MLEGSKNMLVTINSSPDHFIRPNKHKYKMSTIGIWYRGVFLRGNTKSFNTAIESRILCWCTCASFWFHCLQWKETTYLMDTSDAMDAAQNMKVQTANTSRLYKHSDPDLVITGRASRSFIPRARTLLRHRKATRCQDISVIKPTFGLGVCDNILFVYAFLECDTTSYVSYT